MRGKGHVWLSGVMLAGHRGNCAPVVTVFSVFRGLPGCSVKRSKVNKPSQIVCLGINQEVHEASKSDFLAVNVLEESSDTLPGLPDTCTDAASSARMMKAHNVPPEDSRASSMLRCYFEMSALSTLAAIFVNFIAWAFSTLDWRKDAAKAEISPHAFIIVASTTFLFALQTYSSAQVCPLEFRRGRGIGDVQYPGAFATDPFLQNYLNRFVLGPLPIPSSLRALFAVCNNVRNQELDSIPDAVPGRPMQHGHRRHYGRVLDYRSSRNAHRWDISPRWKAAYRLVDFGRLLTVHFHPSPTLSLDASDKPARFVSRSSFLYMEVIAGRFFAKEQANLAHITPQNLDNLRYILAIELQREFASVGGEG
ncbi:hypothetical protein BDK51DRAFT_36977 [Blyttiomyces helicus]|uniref:Uncharacterized protein n=1 Tax=Blyttiomyces helicus TaxID=388810 RepID=A0A4P9W6T4_9FUNG|nr:hypothetical protein BDK51DRAFT_36977 [Blyttiomyces helicus]|eukprot:RKO87093.1 hypothetical protein BDK51DRAFT_36977 [Blyttiomyces helicus]